MSNLLNLKIRESRILLKNPYAYLNDEGGFDAEFNLVEAPAPKARKINLHKLENPYAFIKGNAANYSTYKTNKAPTNRHHRTSLDEIVYKIQSKIWKNRHTLWPNGVPTDPVDLLDPAIALQTIGFSFGIVDSLGTFTSKGKVLEVAGLIDRKRNEVLISHQFPQNTQRFTSAHELGHAVLHTGTNLHRDRPMDGSQQKNNFREKIEVEADNFAATFLMPDGLVKTRFKEVFNTDKFISSEASFYALDPSNSLNLEQKCKYLRDLSRIIAKTEHYNGQYFNSLSNQFHVSIEAMAIRLEELELVSL